MGRRAWVLLAGLVACKGDVQLGECNLPADCDSGEVCHERRCYKVCNLDADCDGGACQGGICIGGEQRLEVEITANEHDVVGTLGWTETVLSWRATRGGSFHVKVAGDCATGINATTAGANGTTAGGDETSTLLAAELQAGSNTVRVCVTTGDGVVAQAVHVIERDEVLPQVIATPPAGDYQTSQQVALACDCDRILYTTDGSTPSFDAAGQPLTGTTYAASIPINGTTALTVTAIDSAGNVSPPRQLDYAILPNPPQVVIVSNQHDFVSTLGYATTHLTFTSDVRGDYHVYVQGDCDHGLLSNGENANGEVQPGVPVNAVIRASDVPIGSAAEGITGSTLVHVCVDGDNGLRGVGQQLITRDEIRPRVLHVEVPPLEGAHCQNPLLCNVADPRLTTLTLVMSEPMPTPLEGDVYLALVEFGGGLQVDGWYLAADLGATATFTDGPNPTWVFDIPPVTLLQTMMYVVAVPSGGADVAGNPAIFESDLLGGALPERLQFGERWLAGPWSDTGRSGCVSKIDYSSKPCADIDSPPFQDGDPTTANAPAARQIQAPAPDDVYTDEVVATDDGTGLVWMTCPVGSTYVAASCVGDSEIDDLSPVAWVNTCRDLNSLHGGEGYAGRTGWRLPNDSELLSILSFGPTPVPGGGILGPPGIYVSAVASYVDFNCAGQCNGPVPPLRIRCVSDEPDAAATYAPQLFDVGKDHVADTLNGLMWTRCPLGFSGPSCAVGSATPPAGWGDALDTCAALTHGGLSDWRAPSLTEAMGLVVSDGDNHILDPRFFRAGYEFWTSTTTLAGAPLHYSAASSALPFESFGYVSSIYCVRDLP